jgi:Fe-S cluster biogenesis protein NfuA
VVGDGTVSADDALPYRDVLARISLLAEQFVNHPDANTADGVAELLDWIDAFHRDGLARLVEMIRAWRGEIFLESVDHDEVVSLLLGVYGLGEGRDIVAEAFDAVGAALEPVRPLVESHGGSIEILSVRDGVVRVHLAGMCETCPSSSATLTHGIEAALREGWPHFRRLEAVDVAETPDPDKADLVCVTVSPPQNWQPVELRGSTSERRR